MTVTKLGDAYAWRQIVAGVGDTPYRRPATVRHLVQRGNRPVLVGTRSLSVVVELHPVPGMPGRWHAATLRGQTGVFAAEPFMTVRPLLDDLASIGCVTACLKTDPATRRLEQQTPGYGDAEWVRIPPIVVIPVAGYGTAAMRRLHRRDLARLKANGVRVDTSGSDGMRAQFAAALDDTAERRSIDDRYRVSRSELDAFLDERFHASTLHAAVDSDGRLLAGSVFVTAGRVAIHHLAATTSDAFGGVSAAKLTVHDGIRAAAQSGAKHVYLGGGIVAGDGLEQYKVGFHPSAAVVAPMTMIRVVLDRAAHETLPARRTEGRWPLWL